MAEYPSEAPQVKEPKWASREISGQQKPANEAAREVAQAASETPKSRSRKRNAYRH